MNSVFLLIGSNLGDRHHNLREARQLISRQAGEIITASAVYQTEAWGNHAQPDFYNQALELKPLKDPQETLKVLLEIEKQMGRIRTEKYGSRTIDIDILFWGDTIIETPELVVPHPQVPYRRFVLVPLSEIAPDFLHPVLHKKMLQLLHECNDPLKVNPLNVID